MEKLQWFKFSTTDWALGKIQRCPENTQFRFLKLCISYWNKECCLTIEDAILEIETEHFELLVKNKIVKVNGDNISILFLDEQFSEILENSEKQRDRVNKRWEKHRLLKDTAVIPPYTTVIPNDTDKNRIDKNRIEDNNNADGFESFWSIYPKKVAKVKCETAFKKLSTTDRQKIQSTLSAFIAYKPFKDYSHPNPHTYLSQKRWNDELPNMQSPILNGVVKTKTNQVTQVYPKDEY